MPAIFHTKVVDDSFEGAAFHIKEATDLNDVVWHCQAVAEGYDGAIFHVKWAEANFDGPVWRVVGIARVIEITLKGRSPLILPNAILAPLESLKAFGGTEQRNLPDGYIQRQFIYMMDESYIDTGIVPDNAGKIEIDFQTTSVQTRNTIYFGTRTNTSTGAGVTAAHTNTAEGVFDAFGQRFSPTQTFDNNTRYLISYDNGTIVWKSGSTVIYTNTSTPTDTTTHSLYINALNNAGTVYGNYEGIYLYSFKVWNAQGVLVADYVPAIQRGTVPVVGFYDTVSGTFKTATAGTFAAGGEAVPTPDAPMDIVSNNGVLRVRKNLFDRNDSSMTINAYIASSSVGSAANIIASDNDRSPVIPVKPNTTYTIQKLGGSSPFNRFRIGESASYPSGGNTVMKLYEDTAATAGLRTATVTTGATTNYIMVYGLNGYTAENWETFKDDFIVCEGDTINVGQIYADGVVETIGLYSANHSNLLAPNMIHQGSMSSSTGEIIYATNRCYTDAIKVNAGETIWASTKNGTPPLHNSARLYSSSGTDTFTGSIFGTAFSFGDYSGYSFTATSDTYIRFLFLQSADFTPADVVDAQATIQSTTPTTYEPYFDGGTATAEMLLSLGDYTDEQEIISGVVTRKLGVKVLDGTEDWELQNASRSVFVIKTLFPADFASNPDNNIGLCTHFTVVARSTTVSSVLEDGQMGWNTNGYLVMRHLASLAEVANFKQYLADQYAAGTPVIIVYPLATETTDTVTGQALQVQAGDNILEITQASLNNLELEVTYLSGVVVTIEEVENVQLSDDVEVTIQ